MASLLDKDAVLRAERLSAMAHFVSLLSIKSYHCRESGCYAKDACGGRALDRGLTLTMVVIYITLHRWQSGLAAIDWINSIQAGMLYRIQSIIT
jgi:hypothetical protein